MNSKKKFAFLNATQKRNVLAFLFSSATRTRELLIGAIIDRTKWRRTPGYEPVVAQKRNVLAFLFQ